jgi:hypothetical protein
VALRRFTPATEQETAGPGAFATAAQRWFDRGWTPIPVDLNRIPLVSGFHGKDREPVSQQLLDKWIKKYTEASLAVVIPDGVVCIDVDTHDEKNGSEEWERKVTNYGEPGPSVIQSTRDPALHGHRFYLFDPTAAYRIRKTLADTNYVDIKGPGGFISVSPTIHHSLGTPYKWYDGELNELPEDYVPEMNTFYRLPESWRGQVEKPTAVYQVKQHGALKRFTSNPSDKLMSILTWDEILEGYFEFTGLSNDVGHILRRVGSKNLTGAVISFDTDKLIVFTSSYSDFLPAVEEGGAYSKYQAWTRIELMEKRGFTEDQAFGPGWKDHVFEVYEIDEHGDPVDSDMLYSYGDLYTSPVKYLWKGGVLASALNLLAGKPGVGKSSYTYNLAADVTRGTVLGDFHGQPGVVIICSTEDSDEKVILPKLKAANADLTKVFGVKIDSMFHFPEDYDRVAKVVESFGGQVRLIILDPLVNRISGTLNAHRDKDVRQALEPFQTLAEKFNLSVLGIVHNNKATDQDPLYSISGSTAFGAVARATLVLGKAEDFEDTQERSIGIVKNNWGPDDLPAYRFKIEQVLQAATKPECAGETVRTTKLVWVGKSEVTQAEEIKNRKNKEQAVTTSKKEAVMDSAFDDMLAYLEDNGPSSAVQIDSNVKANPNTLAALRRQARTSGDLIFNSKTKMWSLPSQSFGAMLETGGVLPDGTAVAGALPQNLGDVFVPNSQGVTQIKDYILANPDNLEARFYMEEQGWL